MSTKRSKDNATNKGANINDGNSSVVSAETKSVGTRSSSKANAKDKPKIGSTINMEDNIGNIVQGKLSIKHGFGCNPTAVDGIQAYSAATIGEKEICDRLIIKIGNQIAFVDPETQSQKYLIGQSRDVRNVHHAAISNNFKYMSVCESIRFDADSPGDAQVSLYSLATLSKIKTLTFPSTADFVYSEFSSDNKHLYGLMNHPTDNSVVIWLWEKEKVFKVISVPTALKRIRVVTLSSSQMFTGSGPGLLKLWYFGIDAAFKHMSLLPPSKGVEVNVLDQAWLKPPLGSTAAIHKMVCLVDLDSPTNSSGHAGSVAGSEQSSLTDHRPSTRSTILQRKEEGHTKKQCIYIFEGQEASIAIPPLALELRQTIFLKPIVTGQNISYATSISTYSKGFILLGSTAIVSIYDRTEEKRDPYVEVKRISLGNFALLAACALPSEDHFAVIGSNGRILSVAMDASMNIAKKQENSDGIAADASMNAKSQMNLEITDIIRCYEEDQADLRDTIEDSSDKLILSTGAIDLMSGGFNSEPIISLDIAYERAIVVTISQNRFCRIWNYETLKCELVHNFKDEEPLCCALSNSGYNLLVSFIDRVILYNILHDKLLPCKEAIQKSCKEIKFSNGNQYWAGASGLNVVVYDTKTFKQLQIFQGHMMMVKKLIWAPGDQVLFSAGTEGNLFGWCVADPDMRIEVISVSNRTSMIVSVELDSNCTAFPPSKKDIDESDANYKPPTRTCIVSTQDSNMKVIPWKYEIKKSNHNGGTVSKKGDNGTLIAGDNKTVITALCLSNNKKYLFAGTSTGKIRIYPWPAPTTTSSIYSIGGSEFNFGEVYVELSAHLSSVDAIKMSPMADTIISAGADGSVFITTFTPINTNEINTHSTLATEVSNTSESSSLADEADYTQFQFNRECLRVGTDDLDKHYQEVASLQKLLEHIKSKATSVYNQKHSQFRDELTKIYDHQEKKVAEEIKKYDKLQHDYTAHSEFLRKSMSTKDANYVEMTKELEHRYEGKLEEQLVRFDKLHEDMEILKQKFDSLVDAEKRQFNEQLADLKHSAKTKEKNLKQKNRLLSDDKSSDESSFKVILGEQEVEYEDELRQLIGAAESEMSKERDNIQKLKVLVCSKNEKLDQLKRKLLEINNIAKARQHLLTNEIQQKTQLCATIEHYKKNLMERETAIKEKDNTIIELTSTTRTLENFRFVLDHRLQQLSSERGPITEHIEGLERHIATMYEELVEEFDLKKNVNENLQLKETKVRLQGADIEKMTLEIKAKEEYISSFKRDMDNIIQANIDGKALEEAVNCVYRKYIRNEQIENVVKANDIVKNIVEELIHNPSGRHSQHMNVVQEDDETAVTSFKFGDDEQILEKISPEIVDTCKESDRQKQFKVREVANLKSTIDKKTKFGESLGRRAMYDNSNLLYDSSSMQKVISVMEEELADVREKHLILTRDLKNMQMHAMELKSQHQKQQSVIGDQRQDNTLAQGRVGSAQMKQRSSIPEEPSLMRSELGLVSKPSISKFKIDLDLRSVDLAKMADNFSFSEGKDDNATTNQSINGSLTVGDIKQVNLKSNSLANFSLATDKKENSTMDTTYQSRGGGNDPKSSSGNQIISVKMNRGKSANAIIGRQPSVQEAGPPILQASASATSFPAVPLIRKPTTATPLPSEKLKHQEKQITSLENKVVSIEQTLDTLMREKDMQRLEITRIRKEIASKSLMLGKHNYIQNNHTQLSPMGSLSYSVSTLNGGKAILPEQNFDDHSESSSKNLIGLSGSRSTSVKPNRSLTSADKTGQPSQDDLKRLALGPRNRNF